MAKFASKGDQVAKVDVDAKSVLQALQAVADEALVKAVEKKIRNITHVSGCAVGGSSRHCGYEYDDVGSVRAILKGDRRIVWIQMAALQKMLGSKKVEGHGAANNRVKLENWDDFESSAFKFSMQDCENAVFAFTAEDWAKLAEENPSAVFMHISKPRDVVYTPPAWIIMEQTVDGKMCISLRQPILTTDMASLIPVALAQSSASACWLFSKLIDDVVALEDGGEPP